jgi:molecular chaperone GrpE
MADNHHDKTHKKAHDKPQPQNEAQEIGGENALAEPGETPDKAETQGGQPEIEAEIVLAEDLSAVQKELEESRLKANEYLEGWQRTLADFSNYKKRVDRDQAQVYQNAAGTIIKRFIEVLDDLDRALKNRPQEGEGAVWANGIELIYRKLITILENEGVKAMDIQGQVFDPNLHEAITLEESANHESGQIIEVLQQGYMLGDRVLRPALVRVAK